MLPFTMTEDFKIVEALAPQVGGGGAMTGDYISCKTAHKVWIVCHITGGHATSLTVGVNEATAVAPTAAAAVTALVPIWSDLDCATSDTIVRRADAATYATDVGVTHKIVVLEWDPAKHTAGFDCIAVTMTNSNNLNIVEALYYIETRYGQDPPPAAITN